jgi:hypothetical protein
MNNFEDFVGEYLGSQQFLFLASEIKEHAEVLLGFFAGACERRNVTPENFSSAGLEDVLMSDMVRLDAPLAVRRMAPELLRVFFEYCAHSGHFPPALPWADWITVLEGRYLAKFRDDGSVKGETFRKRYTDVNRNDPCPCGSGKKFKKCCMGLIS